MRMLTPGGKFSHGEVKIGDSQVMVTDASVYETTSPRTLGTTPVSSYMYVEDADAVFNQAVAAGANVKMPVADAFWGDRCGAVVDPFGHEWAVATHKQDLTPQQIERGAKEFQAKMSKQAGQ